jgi:hypothetical protein
MTDKFPEAFERFTEVVSIKNIDTWNKLEFSFGKWQGYAPTRKQLNALATQARKLGIETTEYTTRKQSYKPITKTRPLIEQQMEVTRETQFSNEYTTFKAWNEKSARTTAYQRRIANYIRNHPNATLAEARGHRVK